MENITDISGFVLAGGKSSRLGTDKALLIIQNESLLARMIGLIRPHCQTLAISGQNLDYENFNLVMVPDLFPNCGPIAGIYSSLLYSLNDWNLIVSVDVPFLNDDLIGLLLANIGEYDCIIPTHHAGIEPLVGLYNRRILPAIKDMIDNGDYKLTRFLEIVNTRYVDCSELLRIYPRLFMNINRIEDYRSI